MPSTLLAALAILVWSSLALLNSRVGAVPPFLAVGIALCVGGLVGLLRAREWKVPLRTFAVGLGGIFGYHALLFVAFRLAPAVEVNLINYLWPLLIVLLSPAILKGFHLGPRHVAGALLGFAGALLIVSGGRLQLDAANLPGYLLASAAALVWACYSLLTKRLPPFPTGAVGGFCLVSGALALGLFFVSGGADAAVAMRGIDVQEWLFLVLLGLGPMGGAFYAWDAALKRGDPRIIGALSYLTPLLSTVNLVLLGGKSLSPAAGVAMALIVAGAAVGSLDLIRGALKRGSRRR